ncbi:AT-rich interactive domain-containing protein 3C-like isoform X1 [Centruroides sculpturatus]|uniref:AT-rich interactive domain-containing protein 3C-like isoform X1 n=2 Tax=Centruroides sculpturatus TaxID=218467 RepID=UPI000C6CB932|nr:AT-rich interactive domain-containing protein 3C-like isoform X1 [Centruroides sculpturatus]
MDRPESDVDGNMSSPDEGLIESEKDFDSEEEAQSLLRIHNSESQMFLRLPPQKDPDDKELQNELQLRNNQMEIDLPHPIPLVTSSSSSSPSSVLTQSHYYYGTPALHIASPYPHSSTSTAVNPPGGENVSSPLSAQSVDQSKYTFEDQFKQLYELSDEPARKDFLDDLFDFMQKRGTPVNRIPIMAKQVLDLYELYKLVVARGGLVEVINRKIWREITKGLNLPSSITSAAFTLRTQYMKYLYPYECEKENLSSPSELQMAIDGNRREGRRSSLGQFSLEMLPQVPRNSHTSPLSLVARHMNGNNINPAEFYNQVGINSRYFVFKMLLNWIIMDYLAFDQSENNDEDNFDQPTQQEALNLEVPRPPSTNVNSTNSNNNNNIIDVSSKTLDLALKKSEDYGPNTSEGPPPKKVYIDDDALIPARIPRVHMKFTSRGDGSLPYDSSVVVSMEMNGTVYQGVLFAQSHKNSQL